jgi:tetratricopeptide (TPR) repeat protein
MSENPHVEQNMLTGVHVEGNLTTGDITQNNNTTNHNNYYPATSSPQYKPTRNLPTASPNFVGRDDVMTRLDTNVQKSVVAVVGMPGVGKTELALQYAHRYGEKYAGGCYWFRTIDRYLHNILTQFIKTEFKLDLPTEIAEPQDIAQWCWQEWERNLPADSQVLIVLDNVDEVAQISRMLPGNSRFRLLVTTRVQALDATFVEEKLEVLTDDAALKLLQQLVGNRVQQEYKSAQQLCHELLGNLPLGIELVGRYLHQDEEISIAEFIGKLGQVQEALDGRDPIAAYGTMTAQRGVKSALELSWQKLGWESQTVAKLLGLCAPKPIPWEVVRKMAERAELEAVSGEKTTCARWVRKQLAKRWKQATKRAEIAKAEAVERITVADVRRQLNNLHLIKWDKEGETATLHPLVRNFFQEKAQTAPNLTQIFAETMLQRAQQASHDMNLERVAGMRDMVPHIEEVATHYTHLLSDDDLLWPFIGTARFYNSQGLYFAALPWYELCLETAEQRLGADHPDTASSLNNLAELYDSIGKYSEALPLSQRALQISEQQLGTNHPDTATSLNNLAALYEASGKYSAALPLYQRALQICEQQLGADHPSTATSLNNLAGLYEASGKYSAALPLYQRALQIYEQQLGADHPHTATSLNNLAALYRSSGKYSEALPLSQRALQIYEQQLGVDHPDTAISLSCLANLYYSMKRSAEAEPLYARAVQICEQSLGTEHPTTVIIRGNYEICLGDKGL